MASPTGDRTEPTGTPVKKKESPQTQTETKTQSPKPEADLAAAGFMPPTVPLKALIHEGGTFCTEAPHAQVERKHIKKECEATVKAKVYTRGHLGLILEEDITVSDQLEVAGSIVEQGTTIEAGTPVYFNTQTQVISVELKPTGEE